MYPNNESKAQSFTVMKKYPQILYSHSEFLANINTQAQLDKPHFSQPDFCPINSDKSEMYLALRASSKVAILKISFNKIELICQMEHQISQNNNNSNNNKVSCLCFCNKPIIKNQNDIFLGFKNGSIYQIDFMNSKLINNYNIMNDQDQECWKKQCVTKICKIQQQQDQFIALFQDSTIIQYSSNNINVNNQLLQQINNYENSIQFDKNPAQFPNQRKKTDYCEIGSIQYEQNFQMVGVYSLNQNKNPQNYYKLKTQSITDILVLSNNHHCYSLLPSNQHTPLIIAYTAYDGYLRIVDINNLQPIFIFKSNFGGINSVNFENEQSPIFAIGCQDDSTIIMNIQTGIYMRIGGQMSFISRSIFLDIDSDEILRVISSSYDGSISINDIQKQIFLNNQSIQNKNLPIKVQYDKQSNNLKQIVSDKESIINVNQQGLGYMDSCGKVIVTSSFDGCSSVWQFMQGPIKSQSVQK